MEQRRHFVGRQKRRARGGLRHVELVQDDRFGAQQFRLLNVLAHPCATAFVIASIVIAIEQANCRAIFVEDFPNPDIGIVNGQIFAFDEFQAVELPSGIEHALLDNRIELEIGLELVFVDGIFLLAQLLCIIGPIPCFELKSTFLCIDNGLEFGGFAFEAGARRIDHRSEHGVDGVDRLCALIFDFVGGVRRIAEHLGSLRLEFEHASDEIAVIGFVSTHAALQRCFVYSFAKCAVFERSEYRLNRCIAKDDEVFAFVSTSFCGIGCRRDFCIAQTRQFFARVD